jgi:hypothetical protein
MLVRPHEISTTKINSKNSLSPLRYFTEYLVDVFRKLPRKNDLDHKSSRLLIRWLKCTQRRVPAKIHTKIHKEIALRNKGPNGQNEETRKHEERTRKQETVYTGRWCRFQEHQRRAELILNASEKRRSLGAFNRD